MERITINPKNTEHPLLSQAILYQSKYTLEISGQVGLVGEKKSLIDDSFENQTKQTIRNIENILTEINWDLSHIVKMRIFLSDMNYYQELNTIYQDFFPVNPPARIALAVKGLPLNALIEIECTAIGDALVVKK